MLHSEEQIIDDRLEFNQLKCMETALILYMLGHRPLFDMATDESMDRIEYLEAKYPYSSWEVDDEQDDVEDDDGGATITMTRSSRMNMEETTIKMVMKMGTKEKKVHEQEISKSWDFHQNLSFLPTFVRGVIPNVHRHYYAFINVVVKIYLTRPLLWGSPSQDPTKLVQFKSQELQVY